MLASATGFISVAAVLPTTGSFIPPPEQSNRGRLFSLADILILSHNHFALAQNHHYKSHSLGIILSHVLFLIFSIRIQLLWNLYLQYYLAWVSFMAQCVTLPLGMYYGFLSLDWNTQVFLSSSRGVPVGHWINRWKDQALTLPFTLSIFFILHQTRVWCHDLIG